MELYNVTAKKDYEEAAGLQLRSIEARRILTSVKSTTAASHALLKERGIDVGVPKRPILPLSDEESSRLRKEFSQLGLL